LTRVRREGFFNPGTSIRPKRKKVSWPYFPLAPHALVPKSEKPFLLGSWPPGRQMAAGSQILAQLLGMDGGFSEAWE